MPNSDRFHKGLGGTIRDVRIEAGLSQEELGLRAGLSRNSISAIELGGKSPTVRTLRAIAKVLKVPVHELLRAAENPQPQ